MKSSSVVGIDIITTGCIQRGICGGWSMWMCGDMDGGSQVCVSKLGYSILCMFLGGDS